MRHTINKYMINYICFTSCILPYKGLFLLNNLDMSSLYALYIHDKPIKVKSHRSQSLLPSFIPLRSAVKQTIAQTMIRAVMLASGRKCRIKVANCALIKAAARRLFNDSIDFEQLERRQSHYYLHLALANCQGTA